jgi:hypothetical protein
LTTPSSTVLDLFLSRVDDYRINTIYSTSGSLALNMYLEPFLFDSIMELTPIATQDLTFIPTSGSVEGYFAQDLSMINKIVLSRICVKSWLIKTINSVLQMNVNLLDHDFKTYAQSQNLSAKQAYLMTVREEISQLLVDYGTQNINWNSWQNQNFV